MHTSMIFLHAQFSDEPEDDRDGDMPEDDLAGDLEDFDDGEMESDEADFDDPYEDVDKY